VEAEVRGVNGEVLDVGAVGEMWLRTPSAMSGYWGDPAGTATTLVDGWLRTGDLATVDPTGCHRLAGRVSEMFIRGGYNVYPLEVEAVLGTHPGIDQVAVVPRPDDVLGEVGVAVVVPTNPDEAPTLDQIIAHGRADLSSYKLPAAVRIVDRLPLNSGDKLDRRALAAEEAGQQADG
jgi:acyl-CoA synthetase (AMP-forming)/AMP-acid ligase II